MPIRRLLLENYRSFRARHEIELAPVTVILGKNNSGKSALTRLPLVLSTGFNTMSTAPLDLDKLGADAVNDFRELYFDHNTLRPLSLGLTVDGQRPFELEVELEYDESTHSAVVSRLRIDDLKIVAAGLLGGDVETPDIDGIALGAPATWAGQYEVRSPGQEPSIQNVDFFGLIPDLGAAGPSFVDISPGAIRYLGPYRERVARQHRLPFGASAGIGALGEGLPGMLAHDREHTGGELLSLINKRLAGIVPDWRIDEVAAGPLRSTVLTRVGSSVRVNLADAGSGLAQVLPILAQCALDELIGLPGEAPLQIIEEPELHLHPAAHAELADLYLATARETGTQFLIETHSETLLLRLRRRIAETDNGFGPETVAIYVVEQVDGESSLRRVGLDSLGNLDDSWPAGYFSQDYREVRALAAAQAERSNRAC